MLACSRPQLVQVAKEEDEPDAGEGRVVTTPLVDLLRRWPLHISIEKKCLAVWRPEKIADAALHAGNLGRLATVHGHPPDLRSTFSRGDERDLPTIGGPSRCRLRCPARDYAPSQCPPGVSVRRSYCPGAKRY